MSNKHKPEFLKPATWPHADDGYGRSPALAALSDLRAWDALPPDVKAKAAAQFYREHPECFGQPFYCNDANGG